MSAKQTGLVWELALPHNEAWVLMAMADHADHEGNSVYPGVPLLAWKTGYTTRQIRRILAILQEKGLIVVEEEGGGRKTTRYRLELSSAERKDPHRPVRARSGRAASDRASESREDKMSPLDSAASEAPMSPQPRQNVRAARTQLCHPNHQGRETSKPSIPPPSDSSPHPRHPLVAGAPPNGENGEGEKKSREEERPDGEVRHAPASQEEAVWRAWTGWAGRVALSADRRRGFDLQAERLASGADSEAWTHPLNGAVVPYEDRPRLLKLGLQHLENRISRTLRGGVMYAVAKHYRTPPPVPATEHAAVHAGAVAGEYPGRDRTSTGSKTMVTLASVLLPPNGAVNTAEEDPVERWERECPEESTQLRDRIARQIAAEVGGRKISDQTLLVMGRAQYRHVALQRISDQQTVGSGASC